ncbi:unnamed protein product [Linum trigynum]|uniref:Uncharacterized protein n=1 Tax=Linum trigynum TaxID=586398 RepID=A0AAV2FW20_9ROSI
MVGPGPLWSNRSTQVNPINQTHHPYLKEQQSSKVAEQQSSRVSAKSKKRISATSSMNQSQIASNISGSGHHFKNKG